MLKREIKEIFTKPLPGWASHPLLTNYIYAVTPSFHCMVLNIPQSLFPPLECVSCLPSSIKPWFVLIWFDPWMPKNSIENPITKISPSNGFWGHAQMNFHRNPSIHTHQDIKYPLEVPVQYYGPEGELSSPPRQDIILIRGFSWGKWIGNHFKG